MISNDKDQQTEFELTNQSLIERSTLAFSQITSIYVFFKTSIVSEFSLISLQLYFPENRIPIKISDFNVKKSGNRRIRTKNIRLEQKIKGDWIVIIFVSYIASI